MAGRHAVGAGLNYCLLMLGESALGALETHLCSGMGWAAAVSLWTGEDTEYGMGG